MSLTASGLPPTPRPPNPSLPLQLLLLLDIWVRIMIWAVALSVTLLVMSRTTFARSLSWDAVMTRKGAWDFAVMLTNFILLFNVLYIMTLVLISLPFPRPHSGVYRMGGSLSRSIILASILAVLTKARFHAPFPGIFVPQMASIMPFRWLLGRTMGPRTRSSFFLDPNIIDPLGCHHRQERYARFRLDDLLPPAGARLHYRGPGRDRRRRHYRSLRGHRLRRPHQTRRGGGALRNRQTPYHHR